LVFFNVGRMNREATKKNNVRGHDSQLPGLKSKKGGRGVVKKT